MAEEKKGQWLGEYVVMAAVWIALIVLFSCLSSNFLSARTFATLANRIPALAVLASGMTLVIITGGIDLSVGSVLGLCGAVLGLALTHWHWSLAAAMPLCAITGLAIGFVNGGVSVLLGVPSFIVTLAMLEIARGLAYLVTGSQTEYIGAAVEGLARPIAGTGLSVSFFVALAVVAACQGLLSKTVLGRNFVAVGSNETAAYFAGVNIGFVKVAAFSLLGFLTGLASVFHTSRLGSADPNAGVGYELSAIAAVVIGGTSLMGGRGSVVNSFFGVLIIATLEAGLAQIGATEPVKRVVTGSVIVAAVIVDAWRRGENASGLLRRWRGKAKATA